MTVGPSLTRLSKLMVLSQHGATDDDEDEFEEAVWHLNVCSLMSSFYELQLTDCNFDCGVFQVLSSFKLLHVLRWVLPPLSMTMLSMLSFALYVP